MIKTIKVKKEFTFRELMEYIIENDISGDFKCLDGKHGFTVNRDGTFYFDVYLYGSNETYEIEVEEEITEDMEFGYLIEVRNYGDVLIYYETSIEEMRTESSRRFYILLDGELVKIWERE